MQLKLTYLPFSKGFSLLVLFFLSACYLPVMGQSTGPPSTSATGWLRLNGNVGVNTSDPKARLQVADGDVYVDKIGSGVILRAPNGGCWRVTVDNSGNLVRTAILCPGAYQVSFQPGPADGQDGYTSTFNQNTRGDGLGMAISSWTTNGGTPVLYQGYFRFDLSAIPATARIDSAFLSLTYYEGWFADSNVGNNPTYVQRVTSPWDQATLTYTNRPGTTAVGQISVPAASAYPTVYQKLNITSLVATPATNYGFSIRQQDETPAPPYRGLLFATSENPTPSYRPRLIVYYSL
ncbi:MAG: DNRLRE domain-containing protein [Cytophagales bacterium]|nr:MAG: DNRLRE domain-containing protein [Cytophagales bacterium]